MTKTKEMIMKYTDDEVSEALTKLRSWLHPGSIVTTVVRHVGRSGMRRAITLIIPDDNGGVTSIDHWVARVLGERIHQGAGGVVVDGAGMDMGFNLVYRLGRRLWPDGTPEPHGRRNGEPDRDGGYALKHRWL